MVRCTVWRWPQAVQVIRRRRSSIRERCFLIGQTSFFLILSQSFSGYNGRKGDFLQQKLCILYRGSKAADGDGAVIGAFFDGADGDPVAAAAAHIHLYPVPDPAAQHGLPHWGLLADEALQCILP